MPEIARRPEIIHGLRNLVQNAVDFADDEVRVRAEWDDSRIEVRVNDDGPGFPGHLLSRIGQPFLRDRRSQARPEYDGMGLGLFISKSLLERSGARIRFSNAESGGAQVVVEWPRDTLEQSPRTALGENRVFGA